MSFYTWSFKIQYINILYICYKILLWIYGGYNTLCPSLFMFPGHGIHQIANIHSHTDVCVCIRGCGYLISLPIMRQNSGLEFHWVLQKQFCCMIIWKFVTKCLYPHIHTYNVIYSIIFIFVIRILLWIYGGNYTIWLTLFMLPGHYIYKYSLLMHCIKIKSRAKSLLNEQYVFVGGDISFLCVLSCISEEA